MTANDFLFGVVPYAVVTLAVVVAIARWRTAPFTITSLSSQLLESRKLYWGSISFHWGLSLILVGHLLALLVVQSVRLAGLLEDVNSPARIEDAPDLGQPGRRILPMMKAVSRPHNGEGAVLEREGLGGTHLEARIGIFARAFPGDVDHWLSSINPHGFFDDLGGHTNCRPGATADIERAIGSSQPRMVDEQPIRLGRPKDK